MSAVDAAEAFTGSRACFEELVGWLAGTEAAGLTHAELEEQLDQRGRELLRGMLQGQLDLRAVREPRREVIDAEGSGTARSNPITSGSCRRCSGPSR